VEQERNKVISIGSTQEKGCSIIIFRTFTLSPVTGNRIMRFVGKLVLQCLVTFEGTRAEGWLQHQDEWDGISLSPSFSRHIFCPYVRAMYRHGKLW